LGFNLSCPFARFASVFFPFKFYRRWSFGSAKPISKLSVYLENAVRKIALDRSFTYIAAQK